MDLNYSSWTTRPVLLWWDSEGCYRPLWQSPQLSAAVHWPICKFNNLFHILSKCLVRQTGNGTCLYIFLSVLSVLQVLVLRSAVSSTCPCLSAINTWLSSLTPDTFGLAPPISRWAAPLSNQILYLTWGAGSVWKSNRWFCVCRTNWVKSIPKSQLLPNRWFGMCSCLLVCLPVSLFWWLSYFTCLLCVYICLISYFCVYPTLFIILFFTYPSLFVSLPIYAPLCLHRSIYLLLTCLSSCLSAYWPVCLCLFGQPSVN